MQRLPRGARTVGQAVAPGSWQAQEVALDPSSEMMMTGPDGVVHAQRPRTYSQINPAVSQCVPRGTAAKVAGHPVAAGGEQSMLVVGSVIDHAPCAHVAISSQLCTGLDPYSHSRLALAEEQVLPAAGALGGQGEDEPPLLLPLPLPLLPPLPLPLLLPPLLPLLLPPLLLPFPPLLLLLPFPPLLLLLPVPLLAPPLLLPFPPPLLVPVPLLLLLPPPLLLPVPLLPVPLLPVPLLLLPPPPLSSALTVNV